MTSAEATLPRRSFGQTMRPDAWWAQPLLVFLGLGAFHRLLHLGGVSGDELLFRAVPLAVLFAGNFRRFAAQLVWTETGLVAGAGLLFSPALLILWAPGGFRLTCYYYRGAYYKAFLGRSAGLHRRRTAQDVSRRALVSAHHAECASLLSLSRAHLHRASSLIDVWKAMWFADPATGKTSFGIGVGTIVLAINVVLARRLHLWLSFAAPSRRRISRSTFASRRPAISAYRCVSCLNRRHMLWAWMSLFWVGFSDLYVRLCSMGVWHDFRFF